MKNYLLSLITMFLVIFLGVSSCTDDENLNPNKAELLEELPDGFQQPVIIPDNMLELINELKAEDPGDYFYLKSDAYNDISEVIPLLYDQKLKVVNFAPAGNNNYDAIVKRISSKEEKFTIVEERPAPVNGLKHLFSFIQNEVKYPEEAKEKSIEGKVFVEFVVNEDGTVSNVYVKKGIGGGCDEEAQRVVALSPKWIPGKINNQPVKVKMILPISFKL